MKKVLIIVLMLVLSLGLIGCNIEDEYFIGTRLVEPEPTQEPLIFENELFNIEFKMIETAQAKQEWKLKGVNFTLYNKTNNSIELIWDEVVFIDLDNQATRGISGDIQQISIDTDTPKTFIPSQTKINENVFPRANIASGEITPMITLSIYMSNEEITRYDNEQFELILPLEIEGEKREYRFTFELAVRELGE